MTPRIEWSRACFGRPGAGRPQSWRPAPPGDSALAAAAESLFLAGSHSVGARVVALLARESVACLIGLEHDRDASGRPEPRIEVFSHDCGGSAEMSALGDAIAQGAYALACGSARRVGEYAQATAAQLLSDGGDAWRAAVEGVAAGALELRARLLARSDAPIGSCVAGGDPAHGAQRFSLATRLALLLTGDRLVSGLGWVWVEPEMALPPKLSELAPRRVCRERVLGAAPRWVRQAELLCGGSLAEWAPRLADASAEAPPRGGSANGDVASAADSFATSDSSASEDTRAGGDSSAIRARAGTDASRDADDPAEREGER